MSKERLLSVLSSSFPSLRTTLRGSRERKHQQHDDDEKDEDVRTERVRLERRDEEKKGNKRLEQ